MVDFETGEVLEARRTPLQIAKSELAGFKFSTIATVRADPKLSSAPCLEVMSIYLDFVTIDERTLKPTSAYASNITLMARGAIKSKTTARAARKLLVENGYLVRIGETKDGCEKYRIENPHFERVQMHVREAEEYFKQAEAWRREDERRKKKLTADRGTVIDPTRDGRGDNNCADRGTVIDPKYHRENLGGFGSREESQPIKVSTTPGYGDIEDDPHLPYPAPESEDELVSMLADLFEGCRLSPETMHTMRRLLMSGNLTPSMVDEQRRVAS